MKKAGRFYSLTEKGRIYFEEFSKAIKKIEERLSCSDSTTPETPEQPHRSCLPQEKHDVVGLRPQERESRESEQNDRLGDYDPRIDKLLDIHKSSRSTKK